MAKYSLPVHPHQVVSHTYDVHNGNLPIRLTEKLYVSSHIKDLSSVDKMPRTESHLPQFRSKLDVFLYLYHLYLFMTVTTLQIYSVKIMMINE